MLVTIQAKCSATILHDMLSFLANTPDTLCQDGKQSLCWIIKDFILLLLLCFTLHSITAVGEAVMSNQVVIKR